MQRRGDGWSTIWRFGVGLAALAGVTLAAAAPGRAELPGAPLVGAARESQNEAIARRFYESALNAKDMERMSQMTSQWVVQHNAPAGDVAGVKQLSEAYARLAAAFPDYQFQLREVLAQGNKVVVRYRFTGTHRGELLGIKASGKSVAVSGVDMLRIEEGKIREVWGTPLSAPLFAQIGVFGAAAPVTGAVD